MGGIHPGGPVIYVEFYYIMIVADYVFLISWSLCRYLKF